MAYCWICPGNEINACWNDLNSDWNTNNILGILSEHSGDREKVIYMSHLQIVKCLSKISANDENLHSV